MAQDDGSSRDEVRRDFEGLRELAGRLRIDEVRQGLWFARLLGHVLDTYARRVDAAYFRARYPGLPADAIVQERVRLAARHAGIEGALSAGAYTGAVAATIGSAGAGSPLTVPAAATTFLADLLYVSALQLRLAHDVAVLYRVPLDVDDPEDVWKLITIAFAIKGGDAGRAAVGKGVPAVIRPVLKRLYAGPTLVAAKSLPVVGKHLLQRNVIKFTIPAVGVPLSVGVNYWSTRTAGTHAIKVFRAEARIVEAARRMVQQVPQRAVLLWVLWMVIKADALVHENERFLLKQVTALVRDVESELAALTELEATVEIDRPRVWRLLEEAEGDRTALYEAAVVAAAVDGKVNVNELKVLRRLAVECGVAYDERAVRDLAVEYAARR